MLHAPARLFVRLWLSLLLAPLGLAAFGSAQASTYYVRPDGGDANECTGRADAPYSGAGVAQACAWKHPFFALPPADGRPNIAGGDTLLIGAGHYMMGQGAPGSNGCAASNCYMAAIPSGSSPGAKTRLLGAPGATPTLWGAEYAKRVLNLEGSSNVEVGNLEVTDHSDCVYEHSNAAAACRTSAPYGAHAKVGLYASASSNVWLHDLYLHGMSQTGMTAGGLTNWTLDRVRINRNGRAGWNANIGESAISSNAGAMILRNVEIGFNGCGERWQTGEAWACWAQQTGGYGDGIGTYYTGGQWLIEDSFVHHNTSDGIDLRYMDGAPGTTVTIRRTYAKANAGNQLKVRGSATIENSVFVSQCAYFRGSPDMLEADNCRSAGNTVQLVMTPNALATMRHNTITGEGGTQIGTGEGDGTGAIVIQNNVIVGQPRWDNPGALSSLQGGTFAGAITWSGNLIWNVNGNACKPASICGQHPQLANMSLSGFDAQPLAGSPVIDRAAATSGVGSDFLLQPRPSGIASDIGAYEWQAVQTGPVGPSMSGNSPPIEIVSPATASAPVSLLADAADMPTSAADPAPLPRAAPTVWQRLVNHAGDLFARVTGRVTASAAPAERARKVDGLPAQHATPSSLSTGTAPPSELQSGAQSETAKQATRMQPPAQTLAGRVAGPSPTSVATGNSAEPVSGFARLWQAITRLLAQVGLA